MHSAYKKKENNSERKLLYDSEMIIGEAVRLGKIHPERML